METCPIVTFFYDLSHSSLTQPCDTIAIFFFIGTKLLREIELVNYRVRIQFWSPSSHIPSHTASRCLGTHVIFTYLGSLPVWAFGVSFD